MPTRSLLRSMVLLSAFLSIVFFASAPQVLAQDLIGTPGDDTLTTDGNYDNVGGLGGNDTITNESPNVVSNFINGGEGNDIIFNSGLVSGVILGEEGDDTITNIGLDADGNGAGAIDGGEGNDTISNQGYMPGAIYGAEGNDKITNTSTGGILGITGDDGDDVITNNGFVFDSIYGGSGNDIITNTGMCATGWIDGEDGDDTIQNSGAVYDGLYGGSGNDTIINTSAGIAIGIDGEAGNDTITNYGFIYDYLLGGSGNDTITNQSSGEINGIAGEAGNDTLVNKGYIDDDIEGGEGHDTITNYGTVGDDIEGNLGDDTITNYGTVKGDIQGKQGHDIIINSGTVGDNIEGDDGNDTVIIQSDATMGNITLGGSGIDTLRFENAGTRSSYDYRDFELLEMAESGSTTLTGEWSGFTSFSNLSGGNTISGSVSADSTQISGGTLYVNGTLTSPSIEVGAEGTLCGSGQINGAVTINGSVNPGNSLVTLTINGNLTLEEGSTYNAEAENGGGSDLLVVNGHLTLNGGSVNNPISLARKLYIGDDEWTIITASGGITGSMGEVSGQPGSQTLLFTTTTTSNQVVLQLTRNPYANLATTSGGEDLGRGLDAIVPLAADSGDSMEELLIQMDFDYSAGQIAEALNQLSPEMYDAFNAWSLATALMVDKALEGRGDILRQAKAGGLSAAPDGSVQLAALSGTKAMAAPGRADPGGWSLWARALGSRAEQDEAGGHLGYDWTSGGGIFGADAQAAPWLRLGFFLAYTQGDMDYSRNSYEGDSEGLSGGIYAAADWQNWFAGAALSYGSYDHEAIRPVSFTSYDGRGEASFGTRTWLGRISGGYFLQKGSWQLGPVGSMRYLHLNQDSYSESGLDYLGISIDSLDEGYLLTGLGFKAQGSFQTGGVTWLPVFSLEWSHWFNPDARKLSAAFRDYLDAPFEVTGAEPSADSLNFQAALHLMMTGRLSAQASYNLAYGGDFLSHSVGLGLWLSF